MRTIHFIVSRKSFAYYFIWICCLFISCQEGINNDKVQNRFNDSPHLEIGLKSALPNILKESSGLCYTDGNLWTFCDGGNLNAIYKIDTSSGDVLPTVEVENFPNIDREDITSDSYYIEDWIPTFVAAAGDPNVKEKLLTGMKAGNKTFRNHLDGYNFMHSSKARLRKDRARKSSILMITAI